MSIELPPIGPTYGSKHPPRASAFGTAILLLAIGCLVAPLTGLFLGYFLELSGPELGLVERITGALSMAILSLVFGGPLFAMPGALAYVLLLFALPRKYVGAWHHSHPWLTSAILGASVGAGIGAVCSRLFPDVAQFGNAAPFGGAVASVVMLSVYVRFLPKADRVHAA